MDQETDFEQERMRLTARAWWATVSYCAMLILLICMVFFGEDGFAVFWSMSPNEVGDLLAGVAGPFALIWLVFGYFMQGIAIRQQAVELRQNTEALRVQAEALQAQVAEMRISVEQQRELVRIASTQLEDSKEAFFRKEIEKIDSQVPKFVVLRIQNLRRERLLSPKRAVGDEDVLKPQFKAVIRNIGGPAMDVSLSISKELYISLTAVTKFPTILHDETFEVQFDSRKSILFHAHDSELTILCNDSMGIERESKLVLKLN